MKTEVRRGRKFVEYIDDSLPVGTFVQEIGEHDVSYQDEAGNWLPADENWQTDGLDGFVLKNDKLNHKVRLKGTGGRTWYPRRNVNTEYMTFGVPQYRNGNKWSNFSFSGRSVEGKTITLQTRQGVTILVHNRWNGVKIDWVLASSTAPSRMRYPVALTGITYVDGIIYGADGTRLGQLTPTTATDANGLELACSGTFAGGYVEFQADVTGAVYPVTVDPDFTAGSTSGYVFGRNATYSTARSTPSYAGTADKHNVGQSLVSSFDVNRLFLNFDTSSIGADRNVTQVNLKLVCTLDRSYTDFEVQIVKYDWSGQDPLASGNRKAAFNGCLAADADDNIWRGTSGISENTQYTSGNLSTTWVNKTGKTYYGLRSNRDYAGTQPTQREFLQIALAGHATESYRPVLIVAYSGGSTAYSLTCAAGSYSLTGSDVTLDPTLHYTLACSAGSLALTGTSATLSVKRNYTLACNAGSYAVTGTAATLTALHNYVLAMGAGAYNLTGADVTFSNTKFYSLACGNGSYALTGSSASFEVKRNYTLACGAGSYALTGTNADLLAQYHYTLTCLAGSYALTGTDISFGITRAYELVCCAGSYTLTGLEADLFKGLVMPCGNGSYVLTGTPATINSARTFVLGMGSYVLVGTACGLFILTPTPACRTATIEFENRTATIEFENRTATIEFENRTLEVKCH